MNKKSFAVKLKLSAIIHSVLLLGLSIMIMSCGSIKPKENANITDSSEIKFNQDEVAPHDWGSVLRKVPGLKVTGSYPNLSIIMRGAKSVSRTSEPLYVLDGVPLGRNFSELASNADPSSVKKVRVLKGPEAAKYGMRGANGVIEVILK